MESNGNIEKDVGQLRCKTLVSEPTLTHPLPPLSPSRAMVTCRLLGDAKTFPHTAEESML